MKIFIFLFACAAVALVQCGPQNQQGRNGRSEDEISQFRSWKNLFGKKYNSQTEENEAIEKFFQNKANIEAHNELADQGDFTFTRALWEHSDKSDDDKLNFFGGITLPQESRSLPATPAIPQFPVGPASVDWGAKGLVGPVQAQAG